MRCELTRREATNAALNWQREKKTMPMIDVYATSGTFTEPKALARELATP